MDTQPTSAGGDLAIAAGQCRWRYCVDDGSLFQETYCWPPGRCPMPTKEQILSTETVGKYLAHEVPAVYTTFKNGFSMLAVRGGDGFPAMIYHMQRQKSGRAKVWAINIKEFCAEYCPPTNCESKSQWIYFGPNGKIGPEPESQYTHFALQASPRMIEEDTDKGSHLTTPALLHPPFVYLYTTCTDDQ